MYFKIFKKIQSCIILYTPPLLVNKYLYYYFLFDKINIYIMIKSKIFKFQTTNLTKLIPPSHVKELVMLIDNI